MAFDSTVNDSVHQIKENYGPHMAANEGELKMILGHCESLGCNETHRFGDYSNVVFIYSTREMATAA